MVSKKLFILFNILLSMVGTKALAYDIAVKNADGVTIYYNYRCPGGWSDLSEIKELEVTYFDDNYNSYSGVVVIPEDVTHNNIARKVTSIGWGAFRNCSGLTSVTIPKSVTTL